MNKEMVFHCIKSARYKNIWSMNVAAQSFTRISLDRFKPYIMLGQTALLTLFLYSIGVMADIRSCNEVIEFSDPRNDFFIGNITSKLVRKREIDPIFIGHPKTQVIE